MGHLGDHAHLADATQGLGQLLGQADHVVLADGSDLKQFKTAREYYWRTAEVRETCECGSSVSSSDFYFSLSLSFIHV